MKKLLILFIVSLGVVSCSSEEKILTMDGYIDRIYSQNTKDIIENGDEKNPFYNYVKRSVASCYTIKNSPEKFKEIEPSENYSILCGTSSISQNICKVEGKSYGFKYNLYREEELKQPLYVSNEHLKLLRSFLRYTNEIDHKNMFMFCKNLEKNIDEYILEENKKEEN